MASASGDPQFPIPVPLLRVPLVSGSKYNKGQQNNNIEKRQAGNLQAEKQRLLFKPSATTAGLARLKSSQIASRTTPKLAKSTTTTTTTTTTARPKKAATTTTTITPTSTITISTTQRPLKRIDAGFSRSLELRSLDSPLSGARQLIQRGTNEPDHQRRTGPTNIVTNKLTSKPASELIAAGPHWSLFNRPDGAFSLFELMVLGSNLLIVGAIVFVILFSWIKSVKRRRSERSKEQDLEQDPSGRSSVSTTLSQTQRRPPSNEPATSVSSIRPPSSIAVSSIASRSDLSQAEKPLAISSKNEANTKSLNEASTAIAASALEQTSKLLTSTTVASKATAIVQPTESSGQPTDLEKQLSNGRESTDKSADQATGKQINEQIDQNKRVDKLEELFSSSSGPDHRVEAGNADPKPAPSSQSRRNSLDSVELPESLVRSIELTGLRGTSKDEVAPSPNLLLGELAKQNPDQAAGIEKMQTGEGQTMKSGGKAKEEKLKTGGRGQEAQEKLVEQPRRAENPMGREPEFSTSQKQSVRTTNQTEKDQALLKNHQLVVNKLENRKTQLEIVDIRDESVTGSMQTADSSKKVNLSDPSSEMVANGWISMDGIAVTQSVAPIVVNKQLGSGKVSADNQRQPSPSDIIGSRFKVNYGASPEQSDRQATTTSGVGKSDSMEEQMTVNNIENELEQDNRLRNRKYFVYIVQDGHFSAKKECIARIELPAGKRRFTLADLRRLIASSQDHSLTSLRRNKFKFVTETYRLLNEDEDTTVLQHVYPTQGVFLKINIAEATENQVYPAFKARGRLSSSSLSNASRFPGQASRSAASTRPTGAAYRRAPGRSGRQDSQKLPQIQVAEYSTPANRARPQAGRLGGRSKSNLEPRSRSSKTETISSGRSQEKLVTQRQQQRNVLMAMQASSGTAGVNTADRRRERLTKSKAKPADGGTSDGLISGAKRLFTATFLS